MTKSGSGSELVILGVPELPVQEIFCGVAKRLKEPFIEEILHHGRSLAENHIQSYALFKIPELNCPEHRWLCPLTPLQHPASEVTFEICARNYIESDRPKDGWSQLYGEYCAALDTYKAWILPGDSKPNVVAFQGHRNP